MRHQPSIGHANLNIKNVHVSSAQAQMEKKTPFFINEQQQKPNPSNAIHHLKHVSWCGDANLSSPINQNTFTLLLEIKSVTHFLSEFYLWR